LERRRGRLNTNTDAIAHIDANADPWWPDADCQSHADTNTDARRPYTDGHRYADAQPYTDGQPYADARGGLSHARAFRDAGYPRHVRDLRHYRREASIEGLVPRLHLVGSPSHLLPRRHLRVQAREQ
jgi:hypothetical protein